MLTRITESGGRRKRRSPPEGFVEVACEFKELGEEFMDVE
jgi:hypothetical protein